MRIGHIGIWAKDIEELCSFYEKYFHAKSSAKYSNSAKKFMSYFLSFDSGAALEIMQMDSVKASGLESTENYFGLAHFAIAVGTKERVDELTAILRYDGYKVVDGPRMTGDGCYESAILDPQGNRVEITEG